jgi:molybdate transport system substrate-binding protein
VRGLLRSARLLAVGAAIAVLLAGCGGDRGPQGGTGPATTTVDRLRGDITVFAAASLADAFTELGAAFETAHPGTHVALNFAASSALREQILGGAPADVFASANQANLDQVIAGGAATASEVFATNALEIAVPRGNPAGITGLADFGRDDLLVGLCADQVPCGDLARQALARAGVTPAVDTDAPDVRALLTQVASGDLDAGIVYLTDVRSAGGSIDSVAIPPDQNVRAGYAIARLTASGDPPVAAAFVAFVGSRAGQRILAAHGFQGP